MCQWQQKDMTKIISSARVININTMVCNAALDSRRMSGTRAGVHIEKQVRLLTHECIHVGALQCALAWYSDEYIRVGSLYCPYIRPT